MKTRTKCSLAICGLLVIEIMPIPFSSIYSLYVVRKRPGWLPQVVAKLYAEDPAKSVTPAQPLGHDPLQTRKNCTKLLVLIFFIDLVVPVIIPTALYVVLKRPIWFQNLVVKLYSDRLPQASSSMDEAVALMPPSPEELVAIDQQYVELENVNRAFARQIGFKRFRTH